MKFLFLIFFLIPLIEIYFLIKIGSIVGALLTVFLVVFTAMLGAVLVRAQGFSTIARVQMQVARGNVPAVEVIEGLMLFLAGALLLTPGFFTDAIGFILLTPPLRRALIFWGRDRGVFRRTMASAPNFSSSGDQGRSQTTQGRVIEGEYKDLD
ncbi:MAG: FxsA family protein [Pseudomonadota bacterium]